MTRNREPVVTVQLLNAVITRNPNFKLPLTFSLTQGEVLRLLSLSLSFSNREEFFSFHSDLGTDDHDFLISFLFHFLFYRLKNCDTWLSSSSLFIFLFSFFLLPLILFLLRLKLVKKIFPHLNLWSLAWNPKKNRKWFFTCWSLFAFSFYFCLFLSFLLFSISFSLSSTLLPCETNTI